MIDILDESEYLGDNRDFAIYADMVLVHGGGPGVESIAAQWADRNGVHQVVCKPYSITSRDDRSALETSEVR